MTGENFTLTPVLGLYKPNYRRDSGKWGDHWNANADMLDAAFSGNFGGPYLPLAGGTVLGPLNYTATNGTTSRSAQDRAAEAINVKDFGARGDGATDDTAAINAAFDHARATANPAPHWTTRVTFPAGRYVVTGPLNLTSMSNIGSTTIIEGCGSQIWLKSAGAVIDCITSRWMVIKDLTIYGDDTNPPRIGMQMGALGWSVQGDVNTLENVKFWGKFLFAAHYNFGSETFTAYSCTFDNNATTPNAFCAVVDGCNHWGSSSTFRPGTEPMESNYSCNGVIFENCTFQGNSPTGNVWIAHTNATSFNRCYASNVSGAIFIVYHSAMDGGGWPAASALVFDCHCETAGLKHMLMFTAPAGTTYAYVIGLSMEEYGSTAETSIIGIDPACSLTTVDIRGARFRIGSGPALFDTPAKYRVVATEALLPDNSWVNPAYWSGPVTNAVYSGTVYVPEHQSVGATTGSSFILNRNMGWLELTPAAPLASYTVTMPPKALHGQTVQVSTTQTITTLTFTPEAGQIITVPSVTLVANTSITYRYDGLNNVWLNLGQSFSPTREITGDTHVTGVLTTTGDVNTQANLVANFIVSNGGYQIMGSGGGSTCQINFLTASGHQRLLQFFSNALSTAGQRWIMGIDGNPESGGNEGSNFFVTNHDDSGNMLGPPLQINRSSGQTQVLSLVANYLGTGGPGGPTWTTGTAAPLAAAPVGSLYSRVGGTVGATLYVSRGGGTWAAVAGV